MSSKDIFVSIAGMECLYGKISCRRPKSHQCSMRSRLRGWLASPIEMAYPYKPNSIFLLIPKDSEIPLTKTAWSLGSYEQTNRS